MLSCQRKVTSQLQQLAWNDVESTLICSGYNITRGAGWLSPRSIMHNIIEQCVEFQQPLSINFIDFKKALNSTHRQSLWNTARLYGIPDHYVDIFRNLYLPLPTLVSLNSSTSLLVTAKDVYCHLFCSSYFIMWQAVNGINCRIQRTTQLRLTDTRLC